VKINNIKLLNIQAFLKIKIKNKLKLLKNKNKILNIE
jgi:hypothetical protein